MNDSAQTFLDVLSMWVLNYFGHSGMDVSKGLLNAIFRNSSSILMHWMCAWIIIIIYVYHRVSPQKRIFTDELNQCTVKLRQSGLRTLYASSQQRTRIANHQPAERGKTIKPATKPHSVRTIHNNNICNGVYLPKRNVHMECDEGVPSMYMNKLYMCVEHTPRRVRENGICMCTSNTKDILKLECIAVLTRTTTCADIHLWLSTQMDIHIGAILGCMRELYSTAQTNMTLT